jgi:hypothetical protein
MRSFNAVFSFDGDVMLRWLHCAFVTLHECNTLQQNGNEWLDTCRNCLLRPRARAVEQPRIATLRSVPPRSVLLAASAAAVCVGFAQPAAADDTFVTRAPAIPFSGLSGPAYNWNGFYAGGNFGLAWGQSNWNAGPGISGSNYLFQMIDTYDEAGSFPAGVQAGYNHVLPNRILLGAEVDASFPAFQTLPVGVNPFGLSTVSTPRFSQQDE